VPLLVFGRRTFGAESSLRMVDGRPVQDVVIPSLRSLETVVASVMTAVVLWRLRKKVQVVFWFNNANLPGIALSRLAGLRVIVNVDGEEWRRPKWNWLLQRYYALARIAVPRIAHIVIVDSKAMMKWYGSAQSKVFIPYGSLVGDIQSGSRLPEGLQAGKYFLQITRPEPDNFPLEWARAFAESGLGLRGFKLVVVGCRPGMSDYADQLFRMGSEESIIVLPPIFDKEVLLTLRLNCWAYLHGNSVGGTNPALLEAMAAAPRILSFDNQHNREVLGGAGSFVMPDYFPDALVESLSMDEESGAYQERISSTYNWDRVADAYMRLLEVDSAS
jgi:glycosyltransferase involved in cell wall biosynthesis